jgi:hypothetical protein
MSDWVAIATTAGLGVAGLYFGQSIRRRTQAEIEAHVAEERIKSYSALWEIMLVAAPSGGGPLLLDDRRALFTKLTKWYFTAGHGMVLSEDTRGLYLTAKNNLVCPPDKLVPKRLRERLEAERDLGKRDRLHGAASVRQLSLLRTSMRADLLVYSGPWGRRLEGEDRAFLRACGVRQWRRPWRPTLRAAAPGGLTPEALSPEFERVLQGQ